MSGKCRDCDGGSGGLSTRGTAIGVLHKLYRAGLRVPDDLSVIGFDDIHIAEVTIPPLTTVQMSQSEIARLAFKALITEVERDDPAPSGTEYLVQTNLVLRKSTALALRSTNK